MPIDTSLLNTGNTPPAGTATDTSTAPLATSQGTFNTPNGQPNTSSFTDLLNPQLPAVKTPAPAPATTTTNPVTANIPLTAPAQPTTINSANTAPSTPVHLADTSVIQPTSTIQSALATMPVIAQPVPATPTAPAVPSANDTARTKLSGLLDTFGTKGDVTTQLNSQYDLAGKTSDAQTTYNQYQQAKLASDQQIAAIYNTPGISREAATLQANEVGRINNANLANLAIIAQSSAGNLTAAQTIIKAKLDAQFQPVQDQIDNLTKYISTNNSDLTQSQITALENQRFQMQNNLDTLKSAKLSAHNFAQQNGITDPSVLANIDNATTPTQAYTAVNLNADGTVPANHNASIQNAGVVALPDGTKITNPQSIAKVSQLPVGSQQYVAGGPQGLVYIDSTRVPSGLMSQIQTQANNAGIPVLDANGIAGVQSLDVVYKNVDNMEKIANVALSSGLSGRLQGLTSNQLLQYLQTGPTVTNPITGQPTNLGTLLGLFNQYRGTAIKAVQALAGGQGSGLRINGAEIDAESQNLPTSTSNLLNATTKLDAFRTLLNTQLSEKFPEIKPENQTPNAKADTSFGTLPVVKTKAGDINPNF